MSIRTKISILVKYLKNECWSSISRYFADTDTKKIADTDTKNIADTRRYRYFGTPLAENKYITGRNSQKGKLPNERSHLLQKLTKFMYAKKLLREQRYQNHSYQ